MKYNENMEIVPDLAEKYDVSADGKTYIFYLKNNIFWQDKTPITVDDIVFTIQTIQNPDYKSPIRANWVGVNVEKLNDTAVKFSIKQPYNSFLENCALKILPSHIWKEISPQNFALSIYNLKPVGSGSYKIKDLNQEKSQINSLTLVPNPLYYGNFPYISEIKFLFFNEEESLVRMAKNGELSGFSASSYKEIKNKNSWNFNQLLLPRYFAVFFNPERSKILADDSIRDALNYATNKEDIAKNALNLENNLTDKIVNSPILPNIYGFENPTTIYNYDLEKAKQILEKAGYKESESGIRERTVQKQPSFQFKSDLKSGSSGTEVKELQKCLAKMQDIDPTIVPNGNYGKQTQTAVKKFQEKYAEEILKPSGYTEGTGTVKSNTRGKLNEVCFDSSPEKTQLTISLATVDQPQMVKTANILKEQWKKAGIGVEMISLPIADLEQNYIRPRNYDALLFGEVLGAIPDPLPFWHSSQKRDPGLNLSLYENKDADQLLEEIRKTLDKNTRAEKLNSFQNILLKSSPAVFLYCPDYIYVTLKTVKNIGIKKIIDPSKRFAGIESWYIETRRVFK